MQSGREIAIIGYACRLPGARRSEELWHLLRNNNCSVSWITPDRFPTEAYYHPSPDQVGRSYTFAAGVIDDVWGFDAAAFGMSPREAEQVDPQHRHLLEVGHDALAHAGVRPSSLAGSDTGVYIGASSVDHAARLFADPSAADVHMMTGNSLSIMANRLSYTLDLRGPSLAVDTACSSSLVALHLAAEAIRNGTIDTAIVGGVNLLLSPFSYVGFSRASMLSPTGLCRPFDAAADGYVRSEGAVVVVLRSMAAAQKARNRIHSVLVGSGMNQDGHTTGVFVPSADSQRRLLDQVYGDFAVDPADLLFVEAHGTGTRVGDPIEADALGKGLGQRRSQPLPIGSVKSNVGHLEPVSGLAGMLKSILALNHGMVPATLHQKSPSPDIPFDELNLRVVDRNWRLPERRGPSLAGINSFGFGGTNAHAIVRSDAGTLRLVQVRNDAPPPLLLTAHSADALRPLAAAYDAEWPEEPRAVPEFIAASAHLRDALPHRLLVRGGTTEEIRRHVRRFADGEKPASVLGGQALGSDLPVAFLFSGNGAQWAGMGRDAWHADPLFREALREIDGHFSKVQKWSLVDMLFAEDLGARLRHATYSQPLLLALQVAMVRVLEDSGVTPVATMGHSVGEIAAAWAAGALSLEQAIDVVTARSRHQESVRDSGGMAALMLSEREARRFLKASNVPAVDIAAVNSWRSVTVSGPIAEIDRMLTAATSQRISARRLDLDYPFHSALVDPVRAPLLRELDGLKPLAMRSRFVSSVTGNFAEAESLGPGHWWRNVREPVQFEAALNCLIKEGLRIFVEIGPRPILSSYIRDVLREAGVHGAVVETMTQSDGEKAVDALEQAASKVFLAGGKIDPHRFFGPLPATALPLPLYPWQHKQFKVQPTVTASTILTATEHPLLGLRPRLDCAEWFSTIDPVLFPWIADHKVGAIPVLPATAYVEVMLAAACEAFGSGALELRELDILRPLVFEGTTSLETLLRLSSETGIAEFLSRPRDGAPDWMLNARGIVSRSPIAGKTTPLPVGPPGTVVVPKVTVYECARGLGFDYGPSFERVHQVVFPHPKVANATLDPPQDCVATGYVTDLTGLDTAFHALFATEAAGVADMPMRRMLPVRFGCVRVFAHGAMASRAIARTIRQTPTSIVVDIDLLDEQGKIILSAQNVRLIDAPVELAIDPRSLSYRTTTRLLDRAGDPTKVHPLAAGHGHPHDVAIPTLAPLAEALLLLEGGCLRAAWAAVREAAVNGVSVHADDREDSSPTEADGTAAPQAFLRAALLWHLEAKNLVVERDGARTAVPTCDLPEIASIVGSLVVRHPTMAGEAAGLSRLGEILGRLVAGDQPVELGSAHWRQLGVASRQVTCLRDAVMADVTAALERCDSNRLIRVLMVGANHAAAASDLAIRYPNLEFVLTDPDADRLEQARTLLGDDVPQIRYLSWNELDGMPARSLDLAFAIDALSEAAVAPGALDRLTRLLRPNAALVAGELAPSVFWDVVRGLRPTWWARSANSDFPVSALLTPEEWADEYEAAGLAAVTTAPVLGDARIGVVIHGVAADREARDADSTPDAPAFSWEGEVPTDHATLLGALHHRIASQGMTDQASGALAIASEQATATDVVWAIDAQASIPDPVTSLSGRLARIAERCRRLAETPARLWVVVDFGNAEPEASPLDRPLWCAITSAMRVAQNEYPGLQVRCVGLSGADQAHTIDRAIDEMMAPDNERELFFTNDTRTVFRVEHGGSVLSALAPSADNTALKLATRHGAGRGALAWISGSRPEPGPGEVEIQVATTGLNFRDVMWNLRLLPEEALEDGYAGASFGMECAGTVTKTGPGVEDLDAGDRVVAFVSCAFASHVIAPVFAVSRLPQELTFEAATTVPVAFLTAYYSLVHLGRLRPGETVLIHGGAGAVGLAALQIAQHCGAKVIATAGSEEKRALLRNFGADYVCNSRALTFADEVASHTGGKGVDVVLNSLAGEAMIRSMDCLGPFGRFIELSKRDFYANTHLGLRPFRKNLTYFGVDIDQLLDEHRELAQSLFADVIRLFAEGKLVPLPYRVFAGEHVGDAFRLMQRSGHIGKIVVTPASHATSAVGQSGKFPVDDKGVHVVIGGTSGFGLATAEWLAGRGATQLVLASRSGKLSDLAQAKVDALRLQGVEVEIAAVDAADDAALGILLRKVAARRTVKGIVHAAMVIDDRLIEGMDQEAIEKVIRPKIAGALHLDRLTQGFNLDYLLLYSSATTLFGNPGQFNYVAANAFLEGLARQMKARGVPALAVAWGGIEDAGYLSRHIGTDINLKKRFASNLISAQTALDGLDWVYDRNGKQTDAVCAIARIDWGIAKRELVATRSPTFTAVGVAATSRQDADAAATLERLRTLPPEEATAALLEIVVAEIARVLRLPAKEVDRHQPLAEIGMDSLMMLELRTTVETALQIELPMMSLASGITPADVARRVMPLITGEGQKGTVPAVLVAAATSHFAADAASSNVAEQNAAVSAVLAKMREQDRSS